jgi:3-oxoacyl-[acyl-carrier protein] reductase
MSGAIAETILATRTVWLAYGGALIVITGASRGTGAAAAVGFAKAGFDVCINFREKAARARKVAAEVERHGQRAVLAPADLSTPEGRACLIETIATESKPMTGLVLNASGGLEPDRDPGYAMRLNCKAQVDLVLRTVPYLRGGGRVVFVTSNQAHRYPELELEPGYEPVARSKKAGERELRRLVPVLSRDGIRLIVATSDALEDSSAVMLLERANPGMIARRRANAGGRLPMTADLAATIIRGVTDPDLVEGQTLTT